MPLVVLDQIVSYLDTDSMKSLHAVDSSPTVLDAISSGLSKRRVRLFAKLNDLYSHQGSLENEREQILCGFDDGDGKVYRQVLPLKILASVTFDSASVTSQFDSIDRLLACLLYTSPSPRD